MPRAKTTAAQPSRRPTEPHSGTTVRAGMPAMASRPTISGTLKARTGTAAPAPPPQAVTTNSKPSTGIAAAIAAQTRKRCRAVSTPLPLVIPESLSARLLTHMSSPTQYVLSRPPPAESTCRQGK